MSMYIHVSGRIKYRVGIMLNNICLWGIVFWKKTRTERMFLCFYWKYGDEGGFGFVSHQEYQHEQLGIHLTRLVMSVVNHISFM